MYGGIPARLEPTINDERDKYEEPDDEWCENVGRVPWMHSTSPGKSQQEKKDSSNVEEDSAKVHLFDFVHDRPVPVEVLEVRWMVEDDIAYC